MPEALQGHLFQFSFATALPESVTVRVHQLRNLEHSVASEFEVPVPSEGERAVGEWSSKCRLASLRASVGYGRLKPKFWSIKVFRV